MNLTNIGLVFDIFGALLIFVFGLPREPFWRATEQIVVNKPEGNPDREHFYSILYRIGEYLGLLLLIIGFLLQLWGNLSA